MTPHNTNATTCSGVVTSQVYSHGGSRRSTTSGYGPNNATIPTFLKIITVSIIIQVVLIGYSIPSSKSVLIKGSLQSLQIPLSGRGEQAAETKE